MKKAKALLAPPTIFHFCTLRFHCFSSPTLSQTRCSAMVTHSDQVNVPDLVTTTCADAFIESSLSSGRLQNWLSSTLPMQFLIRCIFTVTNFMSLTRGF